MIEVDGKQYGGITDAGPNFVKFTALVHRDNLAQLLEALEAIEQLTGTKHKNPTCQNGLVLHYLAIESLNTPKPPQMIVRTLIAMAMAIASEEQPEVEYLPEELPPGVSKLSKQKAA